MFLISLPFISLLTISFNTWSCEAIIGGTPAQVGEFPYVVSIRNETRLHICNGALVTRKHVVTAAHCLYTDKSVFEATVSQRLRAEQMEILVDSVLAGNNPNRYIFDPSKIYQVKETTPHPNYVVTNPEVYIFDIGMITLRNEVTQPSVKPIKRASPTVGLAGEGIVAGWGVNDRALIDSLTPSSTLQKLSVRITDNKICESQFNNTQFKSIFPSIMKNLKVKSLYCVHNIARGGVCIRDSGSPLVVNDLLVGFATLGIPCATGVPDIFTSVIAYSNFVDNVINKK